MRKEFVVFYSPGTLFSESTSLPIESRDTHKAVQMAGAIVERYGAKPYGFVFETRLVADPVPDGEGGHFTVPSKTVDKSGFHFINGTLVTLDEVDRRADPKDHILRSNMYFSYPIVCMTKNGYQHTLPFEEADCVVNSDGIVIERGDDPKHVAYRNAVRERRG